MEGVVFGLILTACTAIITIVLVGVLAHPFGIAPYYPLGFVIALPIALNFVDKVLAFTFIVLLTILVVVLVTLGRRDTLLVASLFCHTDYDVRIAELLYWRDCHRKSIASLAAISVTWGAIQIGAASMSYVR